MPWKFEQVAGPFEFTEGPVWDGSGVLFTDIPSSRILRYDPVTNRTEVVRTGTNEANGLCLDRNGDLYACEGAGRRVVRYRAGGGVDVLCDRFDSKRLNSPNDLIIDSLGRVWFSDPRYSGDLGDLELGHESVIRLDPLPAEKPGEVRWRPARMTYDTTKPNGLALSPDEKTLYVAQSHYGEGNKRELRAYPVMPGGTLGEHSVLHNFYPHRGIDGMTIDSEGNIVATAGWEVSGPGPMIYVFAPSGRVLETHPTPCKRPTNCTFGGPDLTDLYVTGDGCLYRAKTDRKGLARN